MGSHDRRHRHDCGLLLFLGIDHVTGLHRGDGRRLLAIEERLLTTTSFSREGRKKFVMDAAKAAVGEDGHNVVGLRVLG